MGPGACPKCGMALEPVDITAEAEANPELEDMTRRFRVSLVLTVPVFLLAMAHMLPGAAHGPLGSPLRGWLEFLLAAPVVIWGGRPFFDRAWASLKLRSPNMFTLIGLGTGAAFGYSAFALLAPGLFPAAMRDAHGYVGLYFEAAAVIVTLVLLGQVLELRARARTGAAVRALLRLAPDTARRVRADGVEEDVPLHAVTPGDALRVRPGDRVPVDGTVLEGAGTVDESMITGEPVPAEKHPGDKVTGGTLAAAGTFAGTFVMRAEKVGAETLLARIVALTAAAQRSRAPAQRLADRVSAWFVPAVVVAALAAFAGWMLLGPEPRLAFALTAAVSVLIIACPCALGLATPVSVMVATGRGAGLGVLFRDAAALDALRRVDTLVVDKTGTLTEGRPRLDTVTLVEGSALGEDPLLTLAAGLEKGSAHPLADAVVQEAERRGLAVPKAEGFESIPGMGVTGTVSGRRIALGNAALLQRLGIDARDLPRRADALRAEGRVVLFAAVDGAAAGLLAAVDPVRAGARAALDALRADGVRVVMLTGDAHATARAVADALGITEVIAGVLPDQKAARVEGLQAAGRVVAMAGDGINDAPALARADVGIAMGTGADVALESAHVALVKGDLRAIARARALSRAAAANIRQNLWFAFGYNALGVPVAAGVLYPWLGAMLSPMLAAAAMSFSSVSVIANALRLQKTKV